MFGMCESRVMNGMLRHLMTSSKNVKNAKLDYAISNNLLVVLDLKKGKVLLFACQPPNDLDKTFSILFYYWEIIKMERFAKYFLFASEKFCK